MVPLVRTSAQPMNVLYILPVGERGGAERIVESWVAAHTSNVTPFVVMPHGPLIDSFKSLGVWASGPEEFRMSNLLGSVRFLNQVIRRQKIDLIHSSMPKSHLFGGIAAQVSGTREIWFNHGPISNSYYQGLIPLIPSAGLLVNSQYMYTRQASTLYSARRLRLQRLGIDTKLIRPRQDQRRILRDQYRLSDDAVVLGVFGRLVSLKGQDLVLLALARLKEVLPKTRIICFFVGGTLFGLESEYSNRLRSMIDSLGLIDDVVMTDHADDVYGYYDMVDIVVNPSVVPETFGLVVAEAMAKEKIVIASDAGGPRELLQHGVSGFLFRLGDAKELADQLTNVIELNSQTRAIISHEARDFIVNNHDISASVKMLESFYEEVLTD